MHSTLLIYIYTASKLEVVKNIFLINFFRIMRKNLSDNHIFFEFLDNVSLEKKSV